jgi:hypothetical protein
MKPALCVTMLSLLMSLPAQAYEVETGPVMLCDTQKQAERVVQLFNGSQEAAISAVNAEERNPSACAVVEVAYVQGDPLGIARTMSDAFRITPVAVVAMKTPAGFQQVAPAVFFTLVKVKEFAI